MMRLSPLRRIVIFGTTRSSCISAITATASIVLSNSEGHSYQASSISFSNGGSPSNTPPKLRHNSLIFCRGNCLSNPAQEKIIPLFVRKCNQFPILVKLIGGSSSLRRIFTALTGMANLSLTDLSNSYREIRILSERSEEHTSELQSHHDLVCR